MSLTPNRCLEFLSLTCLVLGVSGGNILIRPLMASGSHYMVAKVVATELVNRGHTVTMVVRDQEEANIKATGDDQLFNFEFHKCNFTGAETKQLLENMTKAGLKGKYMEFLMSLIGTDHMQREVSECGDLLLGDEELIARLRNSNFDLGIVDNSEQCPLMQFLGGPYVVLSPILTFASPILLGNRVPFNPAYMPEMMTGLDHKMSFLERLWNTANSIIVGAMFAALPYGELRVRYHKRLADVSFYHGDADFWLINTHYALDFARPLLPNSASVGGLTTREAQPLNDEWVEFLESAGDEGVVLFSMGSYATGIDEDVAAMFAGAFAQLPQKVIWKLNGKPSATVPPNVKVVEWIPQNDLLGHPQIKALVYHCGMNGVWEAVYHGVPVVAVPLFGDQYDNAQRLVSRGMGVKVDISTLTSDELADSIRIVVNDPSYKRNATRISTLFRDTPRKPAELAADWLEYVMRHGGAKHLRSSALDLNIFQYLLFDVILTLLVACIAVFVITLCICRFCFRGCRNVCSRSAKAKVN